jgi:osmotically-inducible protein OsmY
MRTAEQLQADVEQELRWEPSVRSEKIGVSVHDGVVELDGHVGSFYEKWGAERAAFRVANLTSISSEIIVDLPASDERSDEDLTAAANNQLEWNSLVPSTIKLKVSEGWVTLYGTAEWQFQREEATRIFGALLGVKGVSNEIELKPKVAPMGIKAKIEDALKRDAQIDAESIAVEANGSNVTLRGEVDSWSERQEAEHIAFGAPGVSSVANLIEIRY